MSSRNLKLIFIRHAQSEENDKFYDFMNVIHKVRSFQLPSLNQISNSVQLLRVNLDSSLSKKGKSQILDMKNILIDNNFWLNYKPDIILHSPLIRTKQTLLGLLPEENINIPIEELEYLREARPHEYIIKNSLHDRIKSFFTWLDNCNYNTILIVGHGQYIRQFLNVDYIIHNCDVWECNYMTSTSTSTLIESKMRIFNINLLFRTNLSHTYPSEKAYITQEVISIDQGEMEEPTCRICQVMKSENPAMKMIRPCKCSGTLSYVHIDCLNRWRSTSLTAKYTCPTCKYNYNIRRTIIAEFLMNEYGCMIITIIIVIILTLTIGTIIQQCCLYYNYNLLIKLSKILDVESLNDLCSYNYKSYISMIKYYNSMNYFDKLLYIYKLYHLNQILLQQLIICNNKIFLLIEIILYGNIIIGPFGLLHHIKSNLMINRIGLSELIMITSISSLLYSKAIKLFLFLSFLTSYRAIYIYLNEYVHKIGKYLGEQILEPY